MKLPRTVWTHAAAALIAASGGWALHGASGPDAGAAAPPPAAVRDSPAHGRAPATARALPAGLEPPLIAVSADGQVTLRVEQQPLAWVLEQIAQQAPLAEPPAAAPHHDPAPHGAPHEAPHGAPHRAPHRAPAAPGAGGTACVAVALPPLHDGEDGEDDEDDEADPWTLTAAARSPNAPPRPR